MIPDVSYSFFVVLMMALMLVANYSKLKKNHLMKVSQFKFALLLLCLYAVASSFAVYPEEHAKALKYFAKLLVIIFIAYKLCGCKKSLDLVLYGYIAGAWYLSFYIFQVGRNSGGRVEGVGTVDSPDANGVAAALAPSLVLALYYYWVNTKINLKLIFALAGIFIANALILISSRGAFLGVAVSVVFFLFYMFFSSFQRKNQKFSVVFILVAGLGGGVYLADDAFIDRMLTIKQEQQVDVEKESGGTRVYFWRAAIDIAVDYPMGSGYRGFNFYAPRYLPEDLDTGGSRSRSVHSTWFEALTEIGYIGFLALVGMLALSLLSLNKVKRDVRAKGLVDDYFKMIALQASLIAFVVCMTFINRLRAEILYWLVLYSAIAYNVYILKCNEKGIKDSVAN